MTKNLIFLLPLTNYAYSESKTANLHVLGRVLPRLSFRVLHQPSILRVRKKDLKKERPKERRTAVKGRTVISVKTNNRVGYTLRVQAHDSRLFSSIKVTLKKTGQIFYLRPGSQIEIHIPNRGKDLDVNKLDFSFNLLPETQEGKYFWPIAVTAHLL